MGESRNWKYTPEDTNSHQLYTQVPVDLVHLSGSQKKTKKTKDMDVGKCLGRKNLEMGR